MAVSHWFFLWVMDNDSYLVCRWVIVTHWWLRRFDKSIFQMDCLSFRWYYILYLLQLSSNFDSFVAWRRPECPDYRQLYRHSVRLLRTMMQNCRLLHSSPNPIWTNLNFNFIYSWSRIRESGPKWTVIIMDGLYSVWRINYIKKNSGRSLELSSFVPLNRPV